MTLKGPFGTGQDDALSAGHGSGRVMAASGCASVCTAPERHPVTISAGPHMPLPRIHDALVMLTPGSQGTRPLPADHPLSRAQECGHHQPDHRGLP